MKKLITALLLFSTLITLASCGSGGEDAAETVTTAVTTETTAAETGTTYYESDLPEDLDFKGESVSFLYRDEIGDEFWCEVQDGEIVNDALYTDILKVEEQLKCDMVCVRRLGHYTVNRNEYMNHITSTILAGDDLYAWVDLMVGNSPTKMKEGIFYNIFKVKYIDFEKPWYLKDMSETVSIANRLYFITSDASIDYLRCAFCIFFNKTTAENYGVDNLYELVLEGQWTLDNITDITKKVSSDLDGDGVIGKDDQLGFLVHDTNHPKGFMGSCDSLTFSRDADGNWQYTYGSERDANVVEKLHTFLYATEGSLHSGVTDAVADQAEKYAAFTSSFKSGKIMMMTAEFNHASTLLRDMESEYGVLPYPKYDEAQDEYKFMSRNTHNAFSMPTTCGNIDLAGAAYEALSCANYNNLLPAYYEVALKTKYASDDESAQMYDLIHNNIILDFGYTFNNSFSPGPESIFLNGAKTGSFASDLASKKDALVASVEKYINIILDIPD